MVRTSNPVFGLSISTLKLQTFSYTLGYFNTADFILLSILLSKGPFAPCLAKVPRLSMLSKLYYERCIGDVCSAQKDRGYRGCGTIATFAWECNMGSIEINDWRHAATCEG